MTWNESADPQQATFGTGTLLLLAQPSIPLPLVQCRKGDTMLHLLIPGIFSFL